MEISDEEDNNGEILRAAIDEILEDMGVEPNWNDWGEFLGSLKYEYPEMFDNLYFDTPHDLLEIIEIICSNAGYSRFINENMLADHLTYFDICQLIFS